MHSGWRGTAVLKVCLDSSSCPPSDFFSLSLTESLFTDDFGAWLGAHQHGIAVSTHCACVRVDFLKVLRFSFPVPVVGRRKQKNQPPALRAREEI